MPEINWLATGVAALVMFALGGIWFGPKTFFPVWWKAMGRSVDEQPGNQNMGQVFGLTALGQIVQAFALGLLCGALGVSDVLTGALTGFLVGLGFNAFGSLSHRLFAGHGLKVWVLEVASDVLNLTAAGAVFGAFALLA